MRQPATDYLDGLKTVQVTSIKQLATLLYANTWLEAFIHFGSGIRSSKFLTLTKNGRLRILNYIDDSTTITTFKKMNNTNIKVAIANGNFFIQHQ